MSNKKLLITSVFLLLVLLTTVSALPEWITNIQDGNTSLPAYDNNKELIDFGIFFILFLGLSWIGIRVTFHEKEQRNPALAIAIVIALALAISAIKAGFSPGFLVPFIKYFLFIICVLLIYLMLTKAFKIKSWQAKLAIFFAALALLWLLFNLGNFAFMDRPSIDVNLESSTWEKVKDFFKDLGKDPTRTNVGKEIEKGTSKVAGWYNKAKGGIGGFFGNLINKKCDNNSDCGPGDECTLKEGDEEGSCRAIVCTDNSKCGEKAICDIKKGDKEGLCDEVECTAPEHCTDPEEFCNIETNECIKQGCEKDEDCGSLLNTCVINPGKKIGVCQEVECSDSKDSRDCLNGECVQGQCILGCLDDNDCEFGDICEEGVCTSLVGSCQNDKDCGQGEQCHGNVCVPLGSEDQKTTKEEKRPDSDDQEITGEEKDLENEEEKKASIKKALWDDQSTGGKIFNSIVVAIIGLFGRILYLKAKARGRKKEALKEDIDTNITRLKNNQSNFKETTDGAKKWDEGLNS